MVKKEEKVLDESQIINSAIEEGVNAILERHPRFKENQGYILRHIDKRKLNEKIQDVYSNVKERDWSDERKIKYVYEELADYVATGSAFDEAGKEIILKGGLEEKAQRGFFSGWSSRRKLEGEKYLDNVVVAFQDLYNLFKTGEYAERMPEVAEAVSTVHDMGFLDPAVDVLKHYGLINDRKHNVLKKSIMEKTEKGAQEAVRGIERYAIYQKTAAFVFGIIGILALFASGTKITGGIIGGLSNTTIGLIGGAFVLISLILFMWSFKKRR